MSNILPNKLLIAEQILIFEFNYSHTDIVSKHKVNNRLYRGIDKLKRNNEEINENREEVKTNLKNLTSLYYPKCSFFSSYALYSKILNDIILSNLLYI